eukprot:scaffold826_cov87-Skeletonema_dohrnii-CCMP3373.AAC.4
MAVDEYYMYTGGVVPPDVTRVRIDKSVSVITVRAFRGHQNIREVVFHDGVKKVEEFAFYNCPSLRRVIMPGVKEVDQEAFDYCSALTNVECGKLEIIGVAAFGSCKSLRSINLPSAKIVMEGAFADCKALTKVTFGDKLELIRAGVFSGCTSLERITIPLKDGTITDDDVFQGCRNLKYVDLVEVAILHETIAALQMEEWKHEMNEEIVSINQILPTTPAGNVYSQEDVGGKGREVRLWIRSVLHKIVYYKAQHQSHLNEAATTLQLALPSDIVCKNVLPFLELPSYTFELED